MSNGGYKGASPARETSPEQYPGVWELTEQFQAQADGNWPFQADDCAPKSLRFNSSDSAYLSKTPAAAGNRKTWTWSGWVKRSALPAGRNAIFNAGTVLSGDSGFFGLRFLGSQSLDVTTGSTGLISTTAVFRDVSAWYHIVLSADTTIASNQFKLYVNGVLQGQGGSLTLNTDLAVNSTVIHELGRTTWSTNEYLDGYLADVHFIDGQALSCEEFGFFDGQGIWQPKRFTGDYSSGPVYSNFIDNQATGNIISSPSTKGPQVMFDGQLNTLTNISSGYVEIDLSSFGLVADSNGVEIYNTEAGAYTSYQINGGTAVNWGGTAGWQSFGGAGAVNTIRMNYLSGGNVNVAAAIRINGQILTDTSVGRNSFHLDFSDGFNDQSGLRNNWTGNNLYTTASTYGYTPGYNGSLDQYLPAGFTRTNDENDVLVDNNTGILINQGGTLYFVIVPTSTTVTFKHMVYDGSGAFNPTVSLNTAEAWNGTTIHPSSTSGNGSSSNLMISTYNNLSIGTEYFVRTGLTGNGNPAIVLYGTGFNFGVLGTNETDIFVDSPVNGNEASTGAGGQRRGNYCTWNPLKQSSGTYSNGNLQIATSAGNKHYQATFGLTSGKWYWEVTPTAGSTPGMIGIALDGKPLSDNLNGDSAMSYYSVSGNKQGGNTSGVDVSYGASYTYNDVIGVALDLDSATKTLTFYKNGNSQGVAFNPDPTLGSWHPAVSAGSSSNTTTFVANFGQRTFSQTPPAGFSPLATSFMPEPTIKRGDEAMDVALWTGNGSTQTISGLNFSPDFIWHKIRTITGGHQLYDVVRGVTKRLRSDDTSVEGTVNGVTAFNSDGWDMSGGNNSGENYVSWVWDAGDTTTTVAAGGLNSSAYTQDANYAASSNFSGSTTNVAFNNMFNGIVGSETVTGAITFSQYGNSLETTWTAPSTITNITSLRIYVDLSGTATDGAFEVNGTSYRSHVQSTLGAGNDGWVTISESSLSTIKMGRNSNNTVAVGVGAVEVNGKILIDTNLTPPNVPSIASTVRANASAGFSIVSYTGNSTVGATVGHGLNDVPGLVIIKNRTTGSLPWVIKMTGMTGGQRLQFDTGAVYTEGAGSGSVWNATNPSSSVITLGNLNYSNASSNNYIAYCWAPIEGYSAFGSYTGNGSTDGPFVFTGMRPKWLMFKRSDTANSWMIYDAARNEYNVIDNLLKADSSGVETSVSGSDLLDFTSNGFKIREDNAGMNASGGTYIYACFSEHPFASNCRAR